MKPDLFGQVAIVTGASAGIGKAMALRLAGQGAFVVVAARRAERLEQVAEEGRRLGAQMLVVPTDVSDEAQCKALVEKTISTFGQLDVLVNNAGMAASALFDEFPDLGLFRRTMEINFYGAVCTTYYALPHLKHTRGRIIAISSAGGKSAIPYNTPYISSKYAMQGFCDALRMELYQAGVSITVICPWWVVTEFHEAQLDKNGIPVGARGRALYNRKMMTADQCAEISLGVAYKRRREVLMGPTRLAVWLKLLAPGFLDWLAVKIFIDSARRRAQKAKAQARG